MSQTSDPQTLRVYGYTALYTGHDVEHDLHAIGVVSTRNNLANGVTGALVYDRGRFVQVVEGPKDAIARLVTRVQADTRVADWQLLFDLPTPRRSMQDWSLQVLRVDAHPYLHQGTLEAFRDQYLRAFRVDAEGFLLLLRALMQS